MWPVKIIVGIICIMTENYEGTAHLHIEVKIIPATPQKKNPAERRCKSAATAVVVQCMRCVLFKIKSSYFSPDPFFKSVF